MKKIGLILGFGVCMALACLMFYYAMKGNLQDEHDTD